MIPVKKQYKDRPQPRGVSEPEELDPDYDDSGFYGRPSKSAKKREVEALMAEWLGLGGIRVNGGGDLAAPLAAAIR